MVVLDFGCVRVYRVWFADRGSVRVLRPPRCNFGQKQRGCCVCFGSLKILSVGHDGTRMCLEYRGPSQLANMTQRDSTGNERGSL